MLIYIVAGLTTGSIFGLAAVGVVLTYKTSGIFNFSHGALATLSAFLFYFLHDQHGLPWPVAAVICVAVAGPLIGLVLEWVARSLAGSSLPTQVMGTVGLLLLIQGGLELIYPPGPDREVTQFLPIASFSLAGTPVEMYRVIIFAVCLAAVLALTVFLRRSRTGLAMRGVVDDPDLLDISATSPTLIRRYAWLIGSVTASASGVLLAPLLPLDATTLTMLIVTAFGAAAIGAFTSLPLTFVGGLAIGIVQAVLQKYIVSSTGLIAGLPSSLPFLLLFALLLFAPRLRRPSTRLVARRSVPVAWRPPVMLRGGGLVVVLVVLLIIPSFAGVHLADWTRFLAYVVVFISLGLLVRVSGQVSLAQVTFMAIGVCGFSQLAVAHHWPWLAAFLVAGLIAAPIGAVLAIPAIRFPGLYLALATLGFGILVQQMFYGQSYMFGALGVGITVPMPHLSWLGVAGPKSYYYFVLVIAAVITALVVKINNSRLGRLLRAMGDSPRGLASCGVSINVSRVLVFAIASSLAAFAGILDGSAVGTVGSDSYAPLLSLQLFVVVLLSVGGVPWYAILAAAAQIVLPAYISVSADVNYALTAIFGLTALHLAIVGPGYRQLPEGVRNAIDRMFSSGKLRGRAERDAGARLGRDGIPAAAAAAGAAPAGSELRIEDVTVRYGGFVAASQVSLTAAAGRITGLIGPNGAGKTTVLNACAGLVRQSRGRIYLDGQRIDRLGPPARTRRGIGRTFQQMELFDSLTVADNVALGCEGAHAGWNPLDHLFTSRRQRDSARLRAADALEVCGIAGLAGATAGNLTTGQRRLVEMARCLAGESRLLLLDEPSSGLDPVETRRFGELLERVVRQRNVGVMLIEHDMALVNQVCDHVYVIEFGTNLFDGAVAEVNDSAAVRAAYLGEETRADGEPGARPAAAAAPARVSATTISAPAPAREQPAAPVLRIADLTSGYGSTTVLRDVAFGVPPGQVTALLGPNGAGKTTLLRTVCGLIEPTGGTIALGGTDVTHLAPYQRARDGLCLIPEGRGIFRSLTVQENLRLQLAPDESQPAERLERALAVFPALRDHMRQVAGTLSGGQQQMLALARAYVTQPKLILLDEISMGLAPLVVEEMFEAMRALARSGVAMLLVEQYVTRAVEMSDAVVLLNRGAVSYSGPAAGLDEETVLRGYLKGGMSPDAVAPASSRNSERSGQVDVGVSP